MHSRLPCRGQPAQLRHACLPRRSPAPSRAATPLGRPARHLRQQGSLRGGCAPLGAWTSASGPGGGPPPRDGDGGGGSGGGGASHASEGSPAAAREQPAGGEDIIVIDVTGMHCGGCVSKVKRILEAHPSVTQANVNLATEVALVRVVLPEAAAAGASQAARKAGLEALAAQLLASLERGGFQGRLRDPRQGNAAAAAVVKARREERLRRMQAAGRRVATAWLLASACILGHLPHWWRGAPRFLHALGAPQLHAGLSAIALLGPGRQIVLDGWQALRARRPDMNSLVALGACASFAVSAAAAALPALGWPTFFEEPAMLLGCVLLGRALEERAKLAASSDLAALQGLVPEKARLEVGGGGGEWREVPTDALAAGDVLSVLPGDRVPVDGVVLSGSSSANEAALTGEPMPVPKGPGSEVAAGTVNEEGRLRVRVLRAGAGTAIADILRMVEAAQARTAPVQRLADAVAGRFAVGVMAASAATLAFWALAGRAAFPQAVAAYCATRCGGASGGLLLSLQLACNVLTVACPCALGLAAPTAVLVGTSAAARRGLLIRGGDILEAASQVDTVVFDKTGTLTQGRPRLQRVLPAPGPAAEPRQLLALAAALERESSHPLAAAILRAAEEAGCRRLAAEEGSCRQVAGSGLAGRVAGADVAVGTREWVLGALQAQERREASSFLEASTSGAPPGTQVCVSLDGRLAGLFCLGDDLRPDAAATVAHLRRRGFAVHMLSGDSPAAAQHVAAAVGIAPGDVHAGVKPAGKAALVAGMRGAGRRVVMVGDGVNDAAALAAADVGVALGSGVDAATQVAHVVLLGDRLAQVADALDISRRTFAKIQQNLWWAFGYNAVGIPIAAGALLPRMGLVLTPSISGALMGVSSLAVMANSLTLQLHRPPALKGAAAPKQEARAGSSGEPGSSVAAEPRGRLQGYAEKTLI